MKEQIKKMLQSSNPAISKKYDAIKEKCKPYLDWNTRTDILKWIETNVPLLGPVLYPLHSKHPTT